MSHDIIGIIKTKHKEVQVTDKFKKREFILEVQDEKYPQFITFQLTQAKCELLDHFKEGDQVNIYFNLRGKMYTSKDGSGEKSFTSLEAWKIASMEASQSAKAESNNKDHEKYSSQTDDLPF